MLTGRIVCKCKDSEHILTFNPIQKLPPQALISWASQGEERLGLKTGEATCEITCRTSPEVVPQYMNSSSSDTAMHLTTRFS